MTTGGHPGDPAAGRIEVEPTEQQGAANALAVALNTTGGVDWPPVEPNFMALAETTGNEFLVI